MDQCEAAARAMVSVRRDDAPQVGQRFYLRRRPDGTGRPWCPIAIAAQGSFRVLAIEETPAQDEVIVWFTVADARSG